MKFTLCFLFFSILTTSSHYAYEVVLGAPKTQALKVPFMIDFDQQGNLYGVEFEPGHRVFHVPHEGELRFLGGQLGLTAPKDNNGLGDGGPIDQALFNGMHDLAVTKDGRVYIADSWAGRLREYHPKSGHITTLLGTGQNGDFGDGELLKNADIAQLFACALSPDDRQLYVVDIKNRKVRRIDLIEKRIYAFAGNGQKAHPRDGELAVSQPLFNPRAVAVDPRNGEVYIVDRDSHCLLKVDLEGKIHTIVNVKKQKGSAGDHGPALEAQLNGPKHAIVDRQGRVLIADAENHSIRRYDPSNQTLITLAGTSEKPGNAITKEAVLLRRPHGLRFSPDGSSLYIIDSYNDRVLRVNYP